MKKCARKDPFPFYALAKWKEILTQYCEKGEGERRKDDGHEIVVMS